MSQSYAAGGEGEGASGWRSKASVTPKGLGWGVEREVVIRSLVLIVLFHTCAVPISASERLISDSLPLLKHSRVAFKALQRHPRQPPSASQQPSLPLPPTTTTSKTNDALNLEDASIIQRNHPPRDVAVWNWGDCVWWIILHAVTSA